MNFPVWKMKFLNRKSKLKNFRLNPSYNCSLEWLNAYATKEPPLVGDTFNLVPPPSQEFEVIFYFRKFIFTQIFEKAHTVDLKNMCQNFENIF